MLTDRARPCRPPAQTLSDADRRTVAPWAADCAERALGWCESCPPGDRRAREAIARTRAFARGEIGAAEMIRRRFDPAGATARDLPAAAVAAARSAGQAAAVAHMGAHALGAAAYAAHAAGLAADDQAQGTRQEIAWQLHHLTAAARHALLKLPAVGTDRAGPLGPGRLSSGSLGRIIGELQAGLATGEPVRPRSGQLNAPVPGRGGS
jgi:hypothetical protein